MVAGAGKADAPMRLLLTAGTATARKLAEMLAARLAARMDEVEIIYSLAGLTDAPRLPEHPHIRVRQGGFGGVEGLAAWLEREGIAAVIDATHPFARRMPHQVAEAARLAGVPHARFLPPAPALPVSCFLASRASVSRASLPSLIRQSMAEASCIRCLPDVRGKPGHDSEAGRYLGLVDSLTDLTQALPRGARVVVALGSRGVAVLRSRSDLHLHARMLMPPAFIPPPRWRLLTGRKAGAPRGSLVGEMAWLRATRAQWLLARQSAGSHALVLAALRLGVNVLLQRRPAPPPGALVLRQPEEVEDWLRRILPVDRA